MGQRWCTKGAIQFMRISHTLADEAKFQPKGAGPRQGTSGSVALWAPGSDLNGAHLRTLHLTSDGPIHLHMPQLNRSSAPKMSIQRVRLSKCLGHGSAAGHLGTDPAGAGSSGVHQALVPMPWGPVTPTLGWSCGRWESPEGVDTLSG